VIGVEWSDGRQVWAPTWVAMFEEIKGDQWSDYDHREFRAEMAKRSIRWSGTEIDPWLPADKFFKELQRARLLIVIGKTEELV
jgi:hypothetical protein